MMNSIFQNKYWQIATVVIITVFTLSVDLENDRPLQFLPIQLVDKIDADFSFIEDWDYDWGIYENQYGQLSCDGFCPDRAYDMKIDGRIPEDSLTAFYEVVDTSHLHYTMQSEAQMYEWTGCDYIYICRNPHGFIFAETEITPGTHSTLYCEIFNGAAQVWANYNSISAQQPRDFLLKSGFIKVENKAYQSDTIKAQFDLEFLNTLESDNPLTWKGLIYAPINLSN
jgi:hypothetical protein